MGPEVLDQNKDSVLIYIPCLPSSLNRLLGTRGRSFKKSNEVKKWAMVFSALKNKYKIAQFKKAIVSFVFNYTSKRPIDPDNFVKIPLDGLVKSGMLREDSPNYCTIEQLSAKRDKSESTVIAIWEEKK